MRAWGALISLLLRDEDDAEDEISEQEGGNTCIPPDSVAATFLLRMFVTSAKTLHESVSVSATTVSMGQIVTKQRSSFGRDGTNEDKKKLAEIDVLNEHLQKDVTHLLSRFRNSPQNLALTMDLLLRLDVSSININVFKSCLKFVMDTFETFTSTTDAIEKIAAVLRVWLNNDNQGIQSNTEKALQQVLKSLWKKITSSLEILLKANKTASKLEVCKKYLIIISC